LPALPALPAWPAWPAPRERRAGARLGAAILLHVLLLWLLWSALDRVDLKRPAREVWTTLIAGADRRAPALAPTRGAPPPAVAPQRAQQRPPRPPATPAAARPLHEPAVAPQAITLPPAAPASAAVAAAPPASAPSAPIGALLDAVATRDAIRAIARAPLLSERAAAATGIAPAAGANERLAREVDAAHHGDCLHGGFAGSGAWLLSLPFFAVAAATGQCAK
jgi:hypothetical protein